MIKEFEFYHGTVLARLIHSAKRPVSVKAYPTSSNASYIINDSIGLYIKHSSKRMSPWRFSFQREHQDEILHMRNNLDNVYIAFVCHEDGIPVLSFDELKDVLDEVHDKVEWISIARNPREKYTIKGSDGKLSHKIGDNEFPEKLFEKQENHGRGIFSWLKNSR